MLLQGSCHCRAVTYEVQSAEPVPFMRCYCSICRKTAGTGGYAINLGADHRTLQVTGRAHLRVYRATLPDGRTSTAERNFCARCGTALWLWDPQWPDLVHPHAGAVDTPLPEAPSLVHAMLDSKAGWVPLHAGKDDTRFPEYPDESLAAWHARQGLSFGEPGE